MKSHHRSNPNFSLRLRLDAESPLGSRWVPVYDTPVEFSGRHFEAAMSNIIRQPNINSTVIMRADILAENVYDAAKGDTAFVSKNIGAVPHFPDQKDHDEVLYRHHEDTTLRTVEIDGRIKFRPKCEIVRRIIPRNPFKDHIINQTSLILAGDADESVLVVYIPHLEGPDETPFYLPPVYAIGLLYHEGTLSICYMPWAGDDGPCGRLRALTDADRPIRIAMRLLQTSAKHSQGLKDGYEKRVNHDLVVPKEAFQNRYISLKKKYSSQLVTAWAEKTDPKKHVFEDLAIAAFLIELWSRRFDKHTLEFVDLGCGNGLLVYILIMEGYTGIGVDARQRKSWKTYPDEVQRCLQEKIVVPGVLLHNEPGKPEKFFQIPDSKDPTLMTFPAASQLRQNPQMCITDTFGPHTFLIGNHSDELTCWMPLLGFPFLVIPCCSHSLSGSKKRYTAKAGAKPTQTSAYAALVDHVEELAAQMGWLVEKESLRIPSTRNSAIIGINRHSRLKNDTAQTQTSRALAAIATEGGADGWICNALALAAKAARDH